MGLVIVTFLGSCSTEITNSNDLGASSEDNISSSSRENSVFGDADCEYQLPKEGEENSKATCYEQESYDVSVFPIEFKDVPYEMHIITSVLMERTTYLTIAFLYEEEGGKSIKSVSGSIHNLIKDDITFDLRFGRESVSKKQLGEIEYYYDSNADIIKDENSLKFDMKRYGFLLNDSTLVDFLVSVPKGDSTFFPVFEEFLKVVSIKE
ncbi:hypothetical protein OAU52_01120 [bacterium]|nr:hypothetical protein [bacterium]